MALNDKNRELILKKILKHRTDLTRDILEDLPEYLICKEHKNIARYETNHIHGYCIPKNKNIDYYLINKESPGIISFKDYGPYCRRLLYIEHLQCIKANLINDNLEYIPLKI